MWLLVWNFGTTLLQSHSKEWKQSLGSAEECLGNVTSVGSGFTYYILDVLKCGVILLLSFLSHWLKRGKQQQQKNLNLGMPIFIPGISVSQMAISNFFPIWQGFLLPFSLPRWCDMMRIKNSYPCGWGGEIIWLAIVFSVHAVSMVMSPGTSNRHLLSVWLSDWQGTCQRQSSKRNSAPWLYPLSHLSPARHIILLSKSHWQLLTLCGVTMPFLKHG